MQLNSFILDSETLAKFVPANVLESLDSYSYLGNLNLDRLALPFICAALISLFLLFCAKKRLRYRSIAYFFGGIILVRIFLFGNPVSWYIYYKSLDWKDVGFRQVNVINNELRYYFDPPDRVNFLAIGSSQTGAIYSNYAKEHRDLYKVELSGMGPTEYFLYRNIVSEVNPEFVLLYLSEFDLARKPSYNTYRYAPKQWGELLSYSRTLLKLDESREMRDGIKELWIAQIFPEFKYSFIFKGFLKKIMKTNEILDTGVERFEDQSAQDTLDDQISSLKDIFDESQIESSIVSLERFIEYCENLGVKTVIVEGSYHPAALNQKNSSLREKVGKKFIELEGKYQSISYVYNHEIMDLKADDFVDGYHLKELSSDRYASRVVDYVRTDLLRE